MKRISRLFDDIADYCSLLSLVWTAFLAHNLVMAKCDKPSDCLFCRRNEDEGVFFLIVLAATAIVGSLASTHRGVRWYLRR